MDRNQENQVNEIVREYFEDQQEVRILEAGCGSATHIELLENYKVTGIDISMKQLERNKHISEKICADLETYLFKSQSFDIIICSYLLEHLKYPQKVMQNFIKALKPNGLIFLALPNIWSVKGLVTKFTPQYIHIWYYRDVLNFKDAGKDGFGPFKTYLKAFISPNNIKQFANRNNLKVIYFSYSTLPEYERMLKESLFLNVVYIFISAILWAFSFGKIKSKRENYVVVLKGMSELNENHKR